MPVSKVERLQVLLGEGSSPIVGVQDNSQSNPRQEAESIVLGGWVPTSAWNETSGWDRNVLSASQVTTAASWDDDGWHSGGSYDEMVPHSPGTVERKRRPNCQKKKTKVKEEELIRQPPKPVAEDGGMALSEFCPMLAVAKYPYRFMDGSKHEIKLVADAFFTARKIWERNWTVYVFVPLETSFGLPMVHSLRQALLHANHFKC